MKWRESGGESRTYRIGVRPHSHHPVNGNGINGEVGRHCYELRWEWGRGLKVRESENWWLIDDEDLKLYIFHQPQCLQLWPLMQVQCTRLPRMGCAIRPKDTITNPWLLIQPTSPLRSSQHFVHYVHQPHVSQTLPHQDFRILGNNEVISKRWNVALAKILVTLSRSLNERLRTRYPRHNAAERVAVGSSSSRFCRTNASLHRTEAE